MSIHKKADGVFEVRWREGGRNRSLRVHGSYELAKKIERKKMSARDENRHLDVKKEVNFRMSALIDRYWMHYGSKKNSASREKSVLDGIRYELGRLFVREVDGQAVDRWYQDLTAGRESVAGNGGAALQRHAPHDGEGLHDLVQGNRHRPEPGGPGRGEAAGRSTGPLFVRRRTSQAEAGAG